ncbi:MAG: response regulator [Desulfuromonadales bacterium]|nr:response regulator [Desulfuromonadales bacterium]
MTSTSKSNPSISILLVEDDEAILEIQASILTAKYPDVMHYTAANGRLGLDLFKTHTPDIVISDINMPEMCGVQMSNKIRAIKPDTKFIALTGKDSDEILFEFDHIIAKPVVFEDLFAAIEKCLGRI